MLITPMLSRYLKYKKAIDDINANWNIKVVLGAEVTHVPTESIDGVAKKAKDLGAQIVVVHGETLNEPVIEGTNYAAVNSEYVDILGHPGLITYEEAQIAKRKWNLSGNKCKKWPLSWKRSCSQHSQ